MNPFCAVLRADRAIYRAAHRRADGGNQSRAMDALTSTQGKAMQRQDSASTQQRPTGEVVLYRTPDGETVVDVRLEQGTVWLSQAQMAELFQRERSVITKHINNVFRENELDLEGNVQNLHIANSDKPVAFYNLDVIISVGYRVKSKRGTLFRIWATQVLRDHIVKGYTVNQRRLRELKQAVRLMADFAEQRELPGDEAASLLQVVADYSEKGTAPCIGRTEPSALPTTLLWP